MSTQPTVAAVPRDDALFASVRDTVEGTIVAVVGRWYYEECQVGLDSTFAEDIELESMEVMEIAERLIETYEGKVDFVSWFSGMELEDLVELTVGDVVAFIVASIESGVQVETAQSVEAALSAVAVSAGAGGPDAAAAG
jgi:acyl carrier protein